MRLRVEMYVTKLNELGLRLELAQAGGSRSKYVSATFKSELTLSEDLRQQLNCPLETLVSRKIGIVFESEQDVVGDSKGDTRDLSLYCVTRIASEFRRWPHYNGTHSRMEWMDYTMPTLHLSNGESEFVIHLQDPDYAKCLQLNIGEVFRLKSVGNIKTKQEIQDILDSVVARALFARLDDSAILEEELPALASQFETTVETVKEFLETAVWNTFVKHVKDTRHWKITEDGKCWMHLPKELSASQKFLEVMEDQISRRSAR